MKFIKKSLLAAALFTAAFAQAQTADEVIGKSIDAIGGKDKIAGIKSVYMEGSINVMGNDAPVTINLLNGKAYKTEMELNGQKMVQVYTDQGGWTINPFMGSTTAQPLPAEQAQGGRDQIYAGGPLFNY